MLTFRPAGSSDVSAVVALVQSAYRGDASRAGWTTEADLLEGRRADAAMVAGGFVLLGFAGDTLVTCCELDRREDYVYFGMFAVDPERQRAGVGRAMLAEAERFARDEWGAGELRMTVIVQRKELIDWYVRRGYFRTGERTPFPYGDERVGRPLRTDLEFETLTKKLDKNP